MRNKGMARRSFDVGEVEVQRRQHSYREQSRHLGAAVGSGVSALTQLFREKNLAEIMDAWKEAIDQTTE